MKLTAKLRKIKRRLGKNWLPFNLLYVDRREKDYSRSKTRSVKLTNKTTLLIYSRTFQLKNKLYRIKIPRIYTSNLRQIDFKLKSSNSAKSKVNKKLLSNKLSIYGTNKLLIGRLLLIIGVVGLSTSLFFLKDSSTSSLPIPENVPNLVSEINTQNTKEITFLPRSIPTKIAIESVGISAPIISVGKLEDNSMETPYSRTDTGWYKYSPTPGEQGPSVIVGHVDWIDGPAVFYNLSRVKKGAKITVVRKDGKKVTYKAYKTEQYSQDNFPTKKVYGNTEGSELRLITCSGEFDKTTFTYNKNIVVYAKQV